MTPEDVQRVFYFFLSKSVLGDWTWGALVLKPRCSKEAREGGTGEGTRREGVAGPLGGALKEVTGGGHVEVTLPGRGGGAGRR